MNSDGMNNWYFPAGDTPVYGSVLPDVAANQTVRTTVSVYFQGRKSLLPSEGRRLG